MAIAEKFTTQCCALSQICADDNTSKKSILEIVEAAKQQIDGNWWGKGLGAGERAFFIICSPSEHILKRTITKIGFKPIASFDRRSGYPKTGLNTMYFLNF